ncbi:probable inactive receptor kinase At5g67200 [Carica papaya]|uniref:probable inactive receptor kinase At5g67200 n=1 Tax=Carica papaya TaxID=3649 RepID=UPI000B8C8021|nr:probable inactive receptor kinase At5g67200 [Carica papaya]
MPLPAFLLLSLLLSSAVVGTGRAKHAPPPPVALTASYFVPSDAVSLLSFKHKADLDNKLLYTLNEHFDYCQWQGVKCAQGRVVRFVLQSFGLRGIFPTDTVARLDQLRILSLKNNSLYGPIPDLSSLFNLKSLFLSHNNFSGFFPFPILALHRLTTLDLSYNNLTGSIPLEITGLSRLNSLNLEFNRFNGTVPPLNQSFLVAFNVSGNNLTGPIPVTPTLLRFDMTAFSLNPGLCGEIINRACNSRSPFFESPNTASSSQGPPLGQSEQSRSSGLVVLPPPSPKKHKRNGLVLGFAVGLAVVIVILICIFAFVVKKQRKANMKEANPKEVSTVQDPDHGGLYPETSMNETGVIGQSKETQQEKAIKIQVHEPAKGVPRSGNLVFCAGEAEGYTMEQLMRASAELLGRGTVGTTYKAVLDNQLIVTVKRLDANKTAITSSEAFEQHMEAVGELRHPNLVPLRAYFQAKGERLIIYDFQPNGSLFNLIHGILFIHLLEFDFSLSSDNFASPPFKSPVFFSRFLI